MKQLKKLKFIVPPKKETRLEDGDMSLLFGGDNCGTYSACGATGKNTCSSHSDSQCSGGGTMMCGKYYF